MSINVLPPDIMRSKESVDIDNGEILFGLSDVKGITSDPAKLIINMREEHDISCYDSVFEILEKLGADFRKACLDFQEKSQKTTSAQPEIPLFTPDDDHLYK